MLCPAGALLAAGRISEDQAGRTAETQQNCSEARVESRLPSGDKRLIEFVSKSGQGDPAEKVSKARIGAISIKDWVDRQVPHPNRAIFISSLQPFECVVFASESRVDLSQSIGRNVTLARCGLQRLCDLECVTSAAGCRQGNCYLRGVEWVLSG